MKKFGAYTKWILAFILGVALIAVYKTFDNLREVTDGILKVLHVLKPFIFGFVIAYILNLPCKKIAGACRKSRYKFLQQHEKGISVLSIYSIAIILVVVLVWMIVPAAYRNFIDIYNFLYANLPEYIETAVAFIQDRFGTHLFEVSPETFIKAIQDFLGRIDLTQFEKYAQGVMNVTSGVMTSFIAFVVSIYALIDKERILNGVKRVMNIFIPEEKLLKVTTYVVKTNDIFAAYLYSQLIDAAIVAVMATIVLSALKVKYAIVLGLLMGFCNLIPYFGAIIGAVTVILLTFFTGGLFKCIWTGVSLLVLQQFDANFIGPRIMGNMLKLRPIWVIFAVTVGGGLFGVLGMVLSVPVLVVVKMIVSDYLKTLEWKKARKTEETGEES